MFKYGLRDFKGLAIEQLWEEKTTYQVVRFDFSNIKGFSRVEEFDTLFDEYFTDVLHLNGIDYPTATKGQGLRHFTLWLATQSANSVVLLIDEYDAPLTSCLDDNDLFKEVRERMSRFYAAIKNYDRVIRFFFMTGITKFNKTSVFSELNNLKDLSLIPKYGSLLGYTKAEVQRYFEGYLQKGAETLNLSIDDLLEILVRQYDGYCFERTATQRVFAPWSLLNFFSEPECGFLNYWYESGGKPTALKKYFKVHYFRNPEEYGKEKTISLDTLSGSSDVESLSDVGLLTQAGYLTIKGVKNEEIVFLDYPNREVKKSIAKLYLEELLHGKTSSDMGADDIVQVLRNESAESLFHMLNRLYLSIDYKDYPIKDEAALRAVTQVYFDGAKLMPVVEEHNAHGRSDLAVTVGDCHWVLEFKVARKGESATKKLEKAVEKIIENHYGESSCSPVLKRVALVFSLEEKKFVRWQEV